MRAGEGAEVRNAAVPTQRDTRKSRSFTPGMDTWVLEIQAPRGWEGDRGGQMAWVQPLRTQTWALPCAAPGLI